MGWFVAGMLFGAGNDLWGPYNNDRELTNIKEAVKAEHGGMQWDEVPLFDTLGQYRKDWW